MRNWGEIIITVVNFGDQGFLLDEGPTKPASEKFVAAKYSSGKVIIAKNLF